MTTEQLKKRLEETDALYQAKFKMLQQTAANVEILKTECIHLEGQIAILRELLPPEEPKQPEKNDVSTK